MRIEIIIKANVLLQDNDNINQLIKEINKKIDEQMIIFEGSKLGSAPFHKNGMYNYLENVDYETAFKEE